MNYKSLVLEKELQGFEQMLQVIRKGFEKNCHLETQVLRENMDRLNTQISQVTENVQSRNTKIKLDTDKALFKAMSTSEKKSVQRALNELTQIKDQITHIEERYDKLIESKSKAIYLKIRNLKQQIVKQSILNDESALLKLPDEILSDFEKAQANPKFKNEFLRKLITLEEGVGAITNLNIQNKIRDKLKNVKADNLYQLDNDAYIVADLGIMVSSLPSIPQKLAIEKQLEAKNEVMQFRRRLDKVSQALLDSLPKETLFTGISSVGSAKRASQSPARTSQYSTSSTSVSAKRAASSTVGTQKTRQKVVEYEKLIKEKEEQAKRAFPKRRR